MLFLLSAVLCSWLLSVIMRFGEGRVRGRISMLAANYITCMGMGILSAGTGDLLPREEGVGWALGLGAVNGVFYMVALVLTQNSIRKNGVVLSNIFGKLGGLLVPMAVAILAFGELPRMTQTAGAVLAVAAIIAINYDKQAETVTSGRLLVALLAAEGTAAAITKIYEETGAASLSGHFLLYTFTAAFLCCCVTIRHNREKPAPADLLLGLLMGIPNFLSALFLLRALEELPAIIVYPSRSVANILLVSLTGVLMFGERLKKRQWAAFPVVLAALVLLNI